MLLKEDLSTIDIIKYETKNQKQKETIDNICIQYSENLQKDLMGHISQYRPI